MESKKRKIRSGREFDQLFPPPSEQDVTVIQQADVEDTLKLIRRTVPKSTWQTQGIARKLKGRTLEETCSNIWHFVYNHIQYKRDKDGVEQVRSPRRTWWERETGVDCDCYTEFISSILLNFGIPHKARITKYPKRYPEVPRWQHIYPVVPKDGNLNRDFSDRSSYIVLDCVKDEFDNEQPFLERKDYDMRLDYLDGVDDEEEEGEREVVEEPYDLIGMDYLEPDTVDLADLASIYDDEELGSIFKKIGKAVKKVAKKVAKPVAKVVKKVADKVGDGIRIINRFVNPATILLRNGFLLAMKINLLNVAGKLRYGYLTDAQATAMGMNLSELKKIRQVKDRAETVYWQAGGKKENLKKGILHGKGNKNKKVPMNGLFGLNDEYADIEEYQIIHSDPDDLEGLGEIASGTALAAATSAVAAIAAALKQVKGLFNKGGSEEAAFQSETDNAGDASEATATIPDDEDQLVTDPIQSLVSKVSTVLPAAASVSHAARQITQSLPALRTAAPAQSQTQNETQQIVQAAASYAPAAVPAVPATTAVSRIITDTAVQPATTNTAVAAKTGEPEPKGFVQEKMAWIKDNPGKSLLIAGAVAGGAYLLVKAIKGNKAKAAELTGAPSGMARSRSRNKRRKRYQGRPKIERKNLL
jgi:uncharacterized protein YoxC